MIISSAIPNQSTPNIIILNFSLQSNNNVVTAVVGQINFSLNVVDEIQFSLSVIDTTNFSL